VAEPASVGGLRPGDHACLTFSDADERLDIVAAFVRDGLDASQRVLCYVESTSPAVFTGELAERGLPVAATVASGQLVVAGSGEHFLAGGSFGADQVLGLLESQVRAAHGDGYAGLRLTADMCWALRPAAGVEQLIAYEEQVGQLLTTTSAVAVCQYDRERFDTVTLASVTAAHGQAVAAVTYHDDALLRICRQYAPPGLRIAGEMDFRHLPPLARGLTEAIALDPVIHINLRQLRFLDGAAGAAIVQAAASLGPDKRMVATCQPLVGKVLGAISASDLPQLQITVRDVE
jgi:MEDS: MEthanogen/methylotroph, DcmR Sensory domain